VAARKAIPKKARFEVFKRDSFTCQYCGKAAPDVVLHVDHIDPVSKGGGNDILNLITSCADCNGGKGACPLDDQTTLAKQRQQLADLSERREQLKMMLDWRKGMKSIDDMSLEAACAHWSEAFDGWRITSDQAKAKVKKLIREFGLNIVMDSMDAARETYAAELTQETGNEAFKRLGGICSNKSRPDESAVFYARGIVRNRMYCNDLTALTVLRRAAAAGVDGDTLKGIARRARNWTAWLAEMEEITESYGG
jgi:hypothetical protein